MPAPIEQRRVESAAERERFLGSPTLRVDGVDIDPGAGERTDYGLKCRLYPTNQGLRGAPPDEWVLDACSTPAIARPDPGLVFALMLTGPPGAGKTAVLEALTDALCAEDVRHATVEVEALTSAHPPLDDQQWPAPVEAVCALYRRFGYELLLVTATIESDADLQAVLAVVGAQGHVVVRLHAEPATLRQRIIDREPDTFTELDELVAASARLSPVIAGLDGIALALSTEGEQPAAVAERIRDAWPDKLRPA